MGDSVAELLNKVNYLSNLFPSCLGAALDLLVVLK